MKSVAFLDWSLDAECPNCKLYVDLVQHDCDHGENYISGRIFSGKWDDLIGYDIECPHCQHDFKLEKVEY